MKKFLLRGDFIPFSHLIKLLHIMKLSLVLMIVSTLGISASTIYSQETKLSLTLDNVTIKELLKEIKQKSNYSLWYSNNELNDNKRVTIDVKNQSIGKILDFALKGQDLAYEVKDKSILIYKLIESDKSFVQQLKVAGTVKDSATGDPLTGVSVVVEGTNIGTVTDVDGKFIISVPNQTAVLGFSFIGFIPKKVPVENQTNIDVVLSTNIKTLDEVVVVGYGTIKKSDLTGSVSSVKTKDISTSSMTSIDQMLQGRAAGLTLTSVSAQPGGRLNINIRGGTNPLYVIDGVPILTNPNPNNVNTNTQTADPGLINTTLGYSGGVDRDPLNTINPSDIETVDILKDASATAIYGSAAADGVILITTKKGQAGKINVEYRGSYTTQTKKKYFELLNATEFMQQHNRFELDQAYLTTKSGAYGSGSKPTLTPMFSETDIASAGVGTDWLKLLMRDGMIDDQNISISGGNDNTRIFASFNYYGNKAILKNSTFDRYSGRVNFDQQIGKWIKAGANLTFSQINSDNASTGSSSGGSEKNNMLQAAYIFSPAIGVYDSTGAYTKTYDSKITNPAAFLIIKDKIHTYRFIANPRIDVDIIKGLKASLVGGMDRTISNRQFYLPRAVQNTLLPDGMAQLLTNRIDNFSGEGYLTYNHDFANSSLTVVGGAGYYKTLNVGFGVQAVGFFTDAFSYNNISVASDVDNIIMNSYDVERTKISQFFRANYSLYGKYIFSVLGRRDGSSIFAENHKYGFFPGASVAWKINKENFMRDLSIFSDLKLRVGYGSSGNESYLGNNASELYSSGYSFLIGSTYYPGVALSQLANPNLTWETDVTSNLGLDIGILANRITASVDAFIKTKKDLLDYNPLPSNNAVGQIASNVGSQRSKGFEVSLKTINLSGKFTWTTDITMSTYNLNWLTRNPSVALASWIKTKDPVNAVYGWKTAGILKTSADTAGYVSNMTSRPSLGQVKYVDVNKDGLLNDEDIVLLTDATPKWSFGFNNTFRYMGFDLNIYIYGLLGRKIPNGYSSFLSPVHISDATAPYNTIKDIKDVWSSDNLNGKYPGLAENVNPYSGSNSATNTGLYTTTNSDFWLMDASFARIKNITLGYTFPVKLGGINIKSARVYADFQNVYTFTKYKGIDPEATDGNPSSQQSPSIYPQVFSTTFGINVSF
jgi:TonB-dependent starch-binding outer membrane protein SusC